MDHRVAAGACGCGHNSQLLGLGCQRRPLDLCLLHRHHHHIGLWCAGLRRGRILGRDTQAFYYHHIYDNGCDLRMWRRA